MVWIENEELEVKRSRAERGRLLILALSPKDSLQPSKIPLLPPFFLSVFLRTQPFAFVTSPSRAFVLAVATREDLERYSLRRGLSIQRDGAKTPTNANNHTTNGVGASGAGVGGGVGATGNGMGMTRREEEEARKDRTLAEFLRLMDGYEPLVSVSPSSFERENPSVFCSSPLPLPAQAFSIALITSLCLLFQPFHFLWSITSNQPLSLTFSIPIFSFLPHLFRSQTKSPLTTSPVQVSLPQIHVSQDSFH